MVRPSLRQPSTVLGSAEGCTMSARVSCTPTYRLHKARNLAVVTLDGEDHYLGRYGSPERRERYDHLVAEWLARGRRPPVEANPAGPPPADAGPSVNELILA